MIIKTPFKSEKQARKELQDLRLKMLNANEGKDIALDKRDWEVLRWVCNKYGKDEVKELFDVEFDELYEEAER